jgi:excinuclease ABC subunit B
MSGGDRSRKEVLIEYGFRLPAAADNRPLTFDEFDNVIGPRMYVSATPADYELEKSGGLIVEQVVRPTGLLDPPVEVRGTRGQIDDLIEEIRDCTAKDQRVLVTTLTKRMAEELHKFLQRIRIRCTYIHSDVETLERIRILEEFQKGYYDVLIGVNLLREGLDLPQVSLVAILDADKEGFLRSERSLTQTAGRAARNVDGRVIMYADKITDSMARTIRETERRRNKQMQYNKEHGITPTQISMNVRNTLNQDLVYGRMQDMVSGVAEDPVSHSMTPQQLEKAIKTARQKMEEAASKLDFITAAKFREEMYALEKLQK